jgi:hypothetical protein
MSIEAGIKKAIMQRTHIFFNEIFDNVFLCTISLNIVHLTSVYILSYVFSSIMIIDNVRMLIILLNNLMS